jgi:hypothetical protein
VLQDRIGHLLKRPVGRPSNHVRRLYASFLYQAGSWSKKRRGVAKVAARPLRDEQVENLKKLFAATPG